MHMIVLEEMESWPTNPTLVASPEKFRDLARELERDEDEIALDQRLKRLATAPKPSGRQSERE